MVDRDSTSAETESLSNQSFDSTSVLSWQHPQVRSRYKKRRISDMLVKITATASVLLVLYPLADILYMFAYRGVEAISVTRLTQLSQNGGLANNIVGTVILVGLSSIIAVPIGVLGGIYLAEFSGRSRVAGAIRFVADILAGVPSIVLGYVGFLLLVIRFGWGLSAMAGSVTLAILMLPYVLRTTELSLRKVPIGIREAAEALGSTKTQMVNKMIFKLALPGIFTGILLSISISMGETAPLLYTAGSSFYYPTCGLTNCQIGYLTRIFYDFLKNPSPSPDLQSLAYLSAFLLMSFAVLINVVARLGLRRVSRI